MPADIATLKTAAKIYPRSMFPKEYQNSLLIAQKGSWNREIKQGYNLIRVTLDANGNATKHAFIDGCLENVRGRAVTEKNNCVACHAATLVGQQHIPRLAGQHKPYLLEQLKAFKASTRADLDGTMTSAAQGLAHDELEMIAEYLSTLVAP